MGTHIYVTDETKRHIDILSDAENRPISNEIAFLCKERMKVLNLHDNANSSSEGNNTTKKDNPCQEDSGESGEINNA